MVKNRLELKNRNTRKEEYIYILRQKCMLNRKRSIKETQYKEGLAPATVLDVHCLAQTVWA